MDSVERGALRTHRQLLVFQGVVTLLLGLVAFALPAVATLAADIFVGWLFLISGIVGLVALFSANDVPAFLWTLATAALSTAAGVLLVWKPAQGALTFTLLLMALFITEGIFRIATSLLRMRKQEEQRLAAALEALRILGTVRDANRSRA